MVTTVDLQNDDALDSLPEARRFQAWVEAALQRDYAELQQTVRIVDEAESRELNSRYRGKESATNVLAFPGGNELLDYDCLGDLVICAPIVATEASVQNKPVEAHWAHLVIHGMLHLQGFDHQNEADTRQMEALEIKILRGLGVANPYNV
jgi:probable rRNA maturation factor